MSLKISYKLSANVLSTIVPPIPLANAWAESYKPTPLRPLIDMSQGAPGTPPPKLLRDALADVVRRDGVNGGGWGYCPWNGEKEMREGIAREVRTIYRGRGQEGVEVDVNEDDVAITSGCNLAFVAVVMSVAGAGDEVILPVPWYFNHQMDLTLLGITPVSLYTFPSEGFLPSVSRCEKRITSKTRAIALVSPNNPTGATYPPSLIASFLQLARKHNVALILDETYRDFITSPDPPHSLFSQHPSQPSWRENLIHLFSFSKSYLIPGHRLGLIIASPTLLTQLRTILDSLQICPARPMQLALAPLLPSLRPMIVEEALKIEKRHRLFKERLPKGWEVGSAGGYFAFVRHPWGGKGAFGPSGKDEELCQRMASDLGVVALPASFFSPKEEEEEGSCARLGGWQPEDWMRFSVANVDDEKIVELITVQLYIFAKAVRDLYQTVAHHGDGYIKIGIPERSHDQAFSRNPSPYI
ncbi:hypothetical protein AMATHDRAFT_7327 [Amanita thiersii Skay4041]|uniref:Aminotransferase class I/classII large domain-containing protein n=1 Tax=Amanita thiersii Skay4041 TaxID=703135 RepID=A0A2A9N853_9AGAR|nr:hypothetical protein AMATHDRAFT_7327 [Amanita thiersii Skay4041]